MPQPPRILDDKILTDSAGHPILCPYCCEPNDDGGGLTCCSDGVRMPHIYVYGYFFNLTAYGCLADQGRGYATWGTFSGGPWNWNMGTFTSTGTIGCVGVTFSGSCVPVGTPTLYVEYRVSVSFDLGGGHTFGPTLLSSTTTLTNHPIPGDPDHVTTTSKCVLNLACQVAPGVDVSLSGRGLLVTQNDPADGIRCPDGSVVPIDITFNLTLTVGGVPTPFTCTLHYAPFFASWFAVPSTTCYLWHGTLTDCNGACYIDLFWDGANWNILALTPTTGVTVYVGPGFPASGNSVDNWNNCGGDANPTPMWSVTE